MKKIVIYIGMLILQFLAILRFKHIIYYIVDEQGSNSIINSNILLDYLIMYSILLFLSLVMLIIVNFKNSNKLKSDLIIGSFIATFQIVWMIHLIIFYNLIK